MAILIPIEIHIGLHRRIYPDGHQHIHATHGQRRLTRHPSAQGVSKRGKRHQVCHTILCLQGRIFPDIGHIRTPQELQITSHHQGIHRALSRGIEVGKQLAIDQALLALLTIEKLEIIGGQFQVGHHLGGIIEIDIAIDHEGILIVGIDAELIEQQAIALNLYLPIIKAERGACRSNIDRGTIQHQGTIHPRLLTTARNGQTAIYIPTHPSHLIGDESIRHIEREMEEVYISLKLITLRLIESGHSRDLLLVTEEVHIHLVIAPL